MQKNTIVKIVVSALFILLIAASVIFYVVDIVNNNTAPTKNLFKALAVVFICLAGLVKLFVSGNSKRRGLDFYEKEYSVHLKSAFSESPFWRKKLLCAIRLYNENKFAKAIKYLNELKPLCKKQDDFYAVGLFLGLTFTDMGLELAAVDVYNALIKMGINSSTIYGNLGSLHSSLGNYDDAIANMRLSIQNDEKNPAPYNNLAKLYFDTFDFENAKKYAMIALDVNHKFRQSATLLAIIFSLENDSVNAQKYSHIALSSGEDPDRLKKAIEHYKASMNQKDTDEEQSS